MENRRPNNQNPDRPINRNKFQTTSGDKPNGERKFQPRDDQNRPSRSRDFQPRDNRFQPRDANHPRSSRFPKRDDRFQPRDNRSQKPENKFSKVTGKFETKKRPTAKDASWKTEVKAKVYSEMQITDGKHRGKFFVSTTSPKIRATTRSIREAMFALITRKIRGKRFLDLCAGSGAVGLDAVSHGSLLSTFVERSAKMCSFIRKNMASLEIKDGHGEIFEIELIPFLMRMAKRKRFWDVVYLDPPYDANYDEILEYLGRGVCIKPRGILVIEHHAEMFFPEKIGVLKRWRVVVEGESAISLYERD